jgi:hypothetical protein
MVERRPLDAPCLLDMAAQTCGGSGRPGPTKSTLPRKNSAFRIPHSSKKPFLHPRTTKQNLITKV